MSACHADPKDGMIDRDDDHTLSEPRAGAGADRILPVLLRHGSDARCAGDVAEPC